MPSQDWVVLPHRPIEKLTENLWRVEGDLAGMPLKRVMAVAKRASGDLVVHNGVALEEDRMKELDAWGPVRTLIVPNAFHRIDAARFKARYPEAKVYCPAGARAKVEKVVAVDGVYADFPSDDVVKLETLEGTADGEGVMTVKSSDGVTLVFNDAIFNMPHQSGAHGFVFKHLTLSSGGPRVTRIGKMFLVKDKAAFKAHLERLAETPGLKRVIVSHHELITTAPPKRSARRSAPSRRRGTSCISSRSHTGTARCAPPSPPCAWAPARARRCS